MANKRTTETVTTIAISPEISNDIPTPTHDKIVKKVPSELWHCVEDATGIGTLAMNLPVGCLVMTVMDQKQSAIQYIPGIHYDEANRRFTV